MSYLTLMFSYLLDVTELQKFYAANLRGDLFNGFLALGGFLLAAYTFIVLHMKAGVYDHPAYQKNYVRKWEADNRLTLYGPLSRLSARLYWAVGVTLICAVSQLTIGLIPCNLAAIACIAVAVYSCVEVGRAMVLISQNLQEWFKAIDMKADHPDFKKPE